MKNKTTSPGTHPQDARLHRIVYVLVIFCMFGLVVEGTLFVPAIIVWYGWPQLSVQEICDEMHKIIYADPARQCTYPYPLLDASEPRRYQAYTSDLIGPMSPINPTPLYQRIGFRELVTIKEQRLQLTTTVNEEEGIRP